MFLFIQKIFQKLLTTKKVYGMIFIVAGMVKLADTRVLEARAERREGSSPFTRTIFLFKTYIHIQINSAYLSKTYALFFILYKSYFIFIYF